MLNDNKETKICKKCGRELPLDRFRFSSANGHPYYRGLCKDCEGVYFKEHSKKKREKEFTFSDNVEIRIGREFIRGVIDTAEQKTLLETSGVAMIHKIGKGIELDSIYQALSSKFPDIFKGQNNPTEQFRELCQAIQNYRADVAKIEPLDAKTLGLDDSVYQSIIASVEKLNALYQQNNTKASAQESTKEIQNEASAMDKVEESATTAASKKEKFADANKKVEQSAENTTDAVQAEADAMMDMSNLDSILVGVNMQGQQRRILQTLRLILEL